MTESMVKTTSETGSLLASRLLLLASTLLKYLSLLNVSWSKLEVGLVPLKCKFIQQTGDVKMPSLVPNFLVAYE